MRASGLASVKAQGRDDTRTRSLVRMPGTAFVSRRFAAAARRRRAVPWPGLHASYRSIARKSATVGSSALSAFADCRFSVAPATWYCRAASARSAPTLASSRKTLPSTLRASGRPQQREKSSSKWQKPLARARVAPGGPPVLASRERLLEYSRIALSVGAIAFDGKPTGTERVDSNSVRLPRRKIAGATRFNGDVGRYGPQATCKQDLSTIMSDQPAVRVPEAPLQQLTTADW